MTIRAREAVATKFLQDALAADAVGVSKLEAMARARGLLGERQHITHARVFRRAKRSLGIRSIREGFGVGGGWAWQLPGSSEGPAPSSSPIEPPPTPKEQGFPREWVEGVTRLEQHRPPPDIPRHRWRQLVDDCRAFLNSPLAQRAAELDWTAMALFGCRSSHPLSYLGEAGLLWQVSGGKVIEVHRAWAVIDRPVNRSQRIFYRRNVDQAKIALPWTLPLLRTG